MSGRPGSRAIARSTSRCARAAFSQTRPKWACSERRSFSSAASYCSSPADSRFRRLAPHEVAELLRRVRVAESRVQHPVDGGRLDPLPGALELRLDVAAEERRRDHAELHLLRAAPEGLVLVVEDPLQHVPLAAQVDVRDVGLELEDGAHQLRKLRVDVDDLLELVEDERDLPPALRGELARQLEEPLERCVEILWLAARIEAEAELARGRVDGHDRGDPQAREDAQPLPRAEERRGEVVVDRLGELLGEALRGRRRHEVDVGDEHVLGDRLLRDAPHERRLAVAPRSEDDDVLAVQDVGQELLDLGLAIGEGLVEGERAVAERVRRHRTERSIGYAYVRYAYVRNAEPDVA